MNNNAKQLIKALANEIAVPFHAVRDAVSDLIEKPVRQSAHLVNDIGDLLQSRQIEDEMLGRRRKRSNPKSVKSCKKANMIWVGKHKSKSAKGKKIMVRGSCKKSPKKHAKKSKSKSPKKHAKKSKSKSHSKRM